MQVMCEANDGIATRFLNARRITVRSGGYRVLVRLNYGDVFCIILGVFRH